MEYQIKNSDTDEILFKSTCYNKINDWLEYNQISYNNFYICKVIICRECEEEGFPRTDAYNISTGYWCDSCFDSKKYPYRKDKYPTIETHGYGEKLN